MLECWHMFSLTLLADEKHAQPNLGEIIQKLLQGKPSWIKDQRLGVVMFGGTSHSHLQANPVEETQPSAKSQRMAVPNSNMFHPKARVKRFFSWISQVGTGGAAGIWTWTIRAFIL